MLYPKCPVCGGKVQSAEPSVSIANHAFGEWLKQQAAANHPHPMMKAATFVGSAIYELYKRVAGEKVCTNCGHTFH